MMAHSQYSAQAPRLCELCETDTNVQWRCLQCNLPVCDKCKKIHMKVQISIQHDIVAINAPEALKKNIPQILTTDMPCTVHKNKTSCMFCKICDLPVCPDCISGPHKDHAYELNPIDKVCHEKMNYLENTIKYDLMLCKLQSKHIQCREKYFDNVLKKINDQESEIQKAVAIHAQTLRGLVTDIKGETIHLLSEKKQEIQNAEHTLQDIRIQLQTAKDSNSGEVILNAVSGLGKNFPHPALTTLSEELFDFSPAKLTVKDVECLFGSLIQKNIPTNTNIFYFKVVQDLNTDLQDIGRLLTTGNETAWVSHFEKETLQKISIDCGFVQVLQTIRIKVADMTMSQNNEVIINASQSSDVKILTSGGDINQLFSVAPLLTRGLHVTRNNEILLGLREKGDVYKLSKKSVRKIVAFGMDGQAKRSYEYNSKGKRLFSAPYRITTNMNEDILVIDSISQRSGHLIALAKDGNTLWDYTGHPHINIEQNLFDPLDMAIAPEGYVIVSDCNNHAFHVLSREGSLLTFQNTLDLGFMYPLSLNIDKSGQLWVGCNEPKLKCSKICIIKLDY